MHSANCEDGAASLPYHIVICGYGPGVTGVPPAQDGTWYWHMNGACPDIPKPDAIFALHDRRTWKRDWRGYKSFTEGVRGLDQTPLYVWDLADWPDVRTAERFPREAVEAIAARGTYHQSSVDWMLGLAILQAPKAITGAVIVYGPWDGAEPQAGRACAEYWIAVAEAKGITVNVPEPTSLFKTINWVRSTAAYGDPNFRHIYDLTLDQIR